MRVRYEDDGKWVCSPMLFGHTKRLDFPPAYVTVAHDPPQPPIMTSSVNNGSVLAPDDTNQHTISAVPGDSVDITCEINGVTSVPTMSMSIGGGSMKNKSIISDGKCSSKMAQDAGLTCYNVTLHYRFIIKPEDNNKLVRCDFGRFPGADMIYEASTRIISVRYKPVFLPPDTPENRIIGLVGIKGGESTYEVVMFRANPPPNGITLSYGPSLEYRAESGSDNDGITLYLNKMGNPSGDIWGVTIKINEDDIHDKSIYQYVMVSVQNDEGGSTLKIKLEQPTIPTCKGDHCNGKYELK